MLSGKMTADGNRIEIWGDELSLQKGQYLIYALSEEDNPQHAGESADYLISLAGEFRKAREGYRLRERRPGGDGEPRYGFELDAPHMILMTWLARWAVPGAGALKEWEPASLESLEGAVREALRAAGTDLVRLDAALASLPGGIVRELPEFAEMAAMATKGMPTAERRAKILPNVIAAMAMPEPPSKRRRH